MAQTIIVSGLPASGKSTLAQALGAVLGLLVIDKDDFLERHLVDRASFSAGYREESSRRADQEFEDAARQADSAILVSHWRHPKSESQSGTPTEWLRELDDAVEIYCVCSPPVAVERFRSRVRHPGHGDSRWNQDETLQQFETFAGYGPLGIRRLIIVNTQEHLDIPEISKRCTNH
jgi:adenylate kinase family enzyme